MQWFSCAEDAASISGTKPIPRHRLRLRRHEQLYIDRRRGRWLPLRHIDPPHLLARASCELPCPCLLDLRRTSFLGWIWSISAGITGELSRGKSHNMGFAWTAPSAYDLCRAARNRGNDSLQLCYDAMGHTQKQMVTSTSTLAAQFYNVI
jgi:hypothetical protein